MRKRLQGEAFHKVKSEYKLQYFYVSDNGNVKAFLINKYNGYKIVHWLSNEEKIKFKNSEYIKNCYRKIKPMKDGKTYCYGYVKPCNMNGYDLTIKFDPTLIKTE